MINAWYGRELFILKPDSVMAAISMFCFVCSIYLILFPTAGDPSLKMQFVALGTSFFVAGIVVVTAEIILRATRRLLE